jgi:peptide/nickel transport system permease protein
VSRWISSSISAATYILGTTARLLSLLLAVSILSFCLVSAAPFDPVTAFIGPEAVISPEQKAAIAAHWGLYDPPPLRYVAWLNNVLHGDMGISLIYRQPVTEILLERALASLALMGLAWALSGILGFVMGVVCGVFKGSVFDKITKTCALALSVAPTFWLALLALMVFSVFLQWFPMGMAVPAGKLAGDVTLADRLWHLILPALVLSVSGVANVTLHTREKMVTALASNYANFARARSESRWQLVRRHGLRNVALPALTLQFASFAELFGGSVLAEQVFSYPGLGSAVTAAGLRGDIPLLLGIALVSALFVFSGNVIANVLYGLIDPRIRESAKPFRPKQKKLPDTSSTSPLPNTPDTSSSPVSLPSPLPPVIALKPTGYHRRPGGCSHD